MPSTAPASQREAPRVWENNHPFFMIFANSKTVKRTSCSNDVLHDLNIAGERLVLQHSERYLYPNPKDKKDWIYSKKDTRQFHYHATSHCIYSRFCEIYFHASTVHIENTGVRDELRNNGTDLRHPSLHNVQIFRFSFCYFLC